VTACGPVRLDATSTGTRRVVMPAVAGALGRSCAGKGGRQRSAPALVGGLGQQAQDRQSDQERIRRGPRDESERDAKRVVLGLREPVHKLKERGTQLLNRCERELHLGFDPGGPGDPKLARSLDRVVEQRGLADSRFAIHDQHAAMPAAHAVQEPVEHLAFAFPAEQVPC
jgi:hypothetical protein